MSFKVAIPHLEAALTHAKANNAAKAMHHIGHAMLNLRSMTAGAGGASRLPTGGAVPPKAPAQPEAPPPAAGSLRAKLAGLSGGGAGSPDENGGY